MHSTPSGRGRRCERAGSPDWVFDSGFGGLTVMRSLVDQLPNEDFIYLGDTARAPYGPRPIAQVREFALQGLDHLAGAVSRRW